MSELELLYPQIPLNAVDYDESDATQTGFSTRNLSTGSRSLLHKLSTPASEINNTWKQWDLGYGLSDTANYLALARADLLRDNGCTSVSVRASTVSRNTIPDLALSSLKLHLDATKEVTINSTRQVSAWNDQSGNNYDFTQSTSANKPVLSRADNKENLWLYSEQLDHASNLKYQSTVTANSAGSPLDSTAQTADLWLEDAGSVQPQIYQSISVYTSGNYRISFYVKNYSGTRHIYIQAAGAAFAVAKTAWFNITTGAVGTVNAGATSSIESIGSGWYRCNMIVTPTSTAAFSAVLGMCNADNSTAAYTGVDSGFYVFGAQLAESGADTTYLATTDHVQHRGINGFPTIVFDGTDDFLASTAILSNVIANNACTIFTVWETKITANSGLIIGDSAGYLHVRRSSSNFQISNDDGAGDSASTAIAISTVYVSENRHESGNIYTKVNNGTEVSAASGNTADLTNILRCGGGSATACHGGKIAEILVFNAALTAAQRSTIYTYLATKYTTAAAAICDVESATLVGPFDQDYITTFTATTSSRYYWFDMNCNTPSTTVLFPLSKVYLGTRYNFNSKDPVYPYSTNYRKPMRDFTADSGTCFRSREGREQIIYRFQWFLDDDTRDDFMNKVGRYWDINPVMLWTSSASFDAPLNQNTLIHGWIESLNFQSTGPVANQNTLTLEVMQDL